MEVKEISKKTISQIKQVIYQNRNNELSPYMTLSGAVAIILKMEIKERQFLEYAIENHTHLLDLINKDSEDVLIIKNSDNDFYFAVNGKRVYSNYQSCC